MKKTCIIVEDEYPASLRMRQLLSDYEHEIDIIGEANTAKKAIEMIMSERPDVVFLDIQMPDMTGFEVLANIDFQPLIVFTTAYSEYALKAFENYSIDYLIKPISKERFATAMEKLSNWGDKNKLDLGLVQQILLELKQPKKSFSIAIKTKDKIILVNYEDIAFFKAEDKYVNVHLISGKIHLLSKSLSQLLEELPADFVRVHRSYITNKKVVVEIQKYFKGKYILKLSDLDQTKITTGETYTKVVKEEFGL